MSTLQIFKMTLSLAGGKNSIDMIVDMSILEDELSFQREILSLRRELKLLKLSGKQFVPNLKRLKKGKNYLLNKKYWSILCSHKQDFIFTGSLSLLTFGLLDREINDLDFVSYSKVTTELLESLKVEIVTGWDTEGRYRYNGQLRQLRQLGQNDNSLCSEVGILGTKNSYLIDYFNKVDNMDTIKFEGMTFQCPLQVLLKKIEYLSKGTPYSPIEKHYRDLKLAIHKIHISKD